MSIWSELILMVAFLVDSSGVAQCNGVLGLSSCNQKVN
jgi:hypothetical protein